MCLIAKATNLFLHSINDATITNIYSLVLTVYHKGSHCLKKKKGKGKKKERMKERVFYFATFPFVNKTPHKQNQRSLANKQNMPVSRRIQFPSSFKIQLC